jgi:hypothetical protein
MIFFMLYDNGEDSLFEEQTELKSKNKQLKLLWKKFSFHFDNAAGLKFVSCNV